VGAATAVGGLLLWGLAVMLDSRRKGGVAGSR
jgi:DHA1 family inner membrane transport protein